MPAISAAGNGIFMFGAESTRLSSLRPPGAYFGAAGMGPTGRYFVNSAIRSDRATSVGPRLKGKIVHRIWMTGGFRRTAQDAWASMTVYRAIPQV